MYVKYVREIVDRWIQIAYDISFEYVALKRWATNADVYNRERNEGIGAIHSLETFETIFSVSVTRLTTGRPPPTSDLLDEQPAILTTVQRGMMSVVTGFETRGRPPQSMYLFNDEIETG